MKLFDVDGPLMAALNKLADLVFANLLFILFSLPVVTLGVSLTALQTVVLALAEDEENLVVRKRFWQAFRRDFKQSTLLWGIFAAAALILMGSNAAAQSMGGSLGRFYAVFLGALGILLAMAFLMAFPLQSRYPAPAVQTVKTAFLLMVLRLPLAAGMLAVYLSFFLNPDLFGGALFLWLAVGFALVAYLNAFLALRAFRVLPDSGEN